MSARPLKQVVLAVVANVAYYVLTFQVVHQYLENADRDCDETPAFCVLLRPNPRVILYAMSNQRARYQKCIQIHAGYIRAHDVPGSSHKHERIFYYTALHKLKYARLHRLLARRHDQIFATSGGPATSSDTMSIDRRDQHIQDDVDSFFSTDHDKDHIILTDDMDSHIEASNRETTGRSSEKIEAAEFSFRADELKASVLAQSKLDAERRRHEAERQRMKFSNFFAARYTMIARITQPNHPEAIEQCEFESTTCHQLKARPKPLLKEDTPEPWKLLQCSCVIGTTASNSDVFNTLKPLSYELQHPQNRVMCVGADGFSGSGKSYTMESLLLNIGADLFHSGGDLREVVFEAFQSSGKDVDSLDFSDHKVSSGLYKMDSSPIRLGTGAIIPGKRPCYQVTLFEAFELLLKKTKDFRHSGITNNNATSSRTHLVILVQVTMMKKTSLLCIFDMAGNERSDAVNGIEGDEKKRLEQTIRINDSRMKIHVVFKSAVSRKKLVTRESAVSDLLYRFINETSLAYVCTGWYASDETSL